jgi:nicotinamidase-related amidase
MDDERMLLDIETQWDFFLPSGSLYTRAAGKAAREIYRLFAWAKGHEIPVVSTLLRVRRGIR